MIKLALIVAGSVVLVAALLLCLALWALRESDALAGELEE